MNTCSDFPATHIDLEEALQRARTDYREMPGLRLTVRQASRLWVLHPAMCERVLRSLMEEQFLHRAANDVFVLAR